MQEYPVDFPVDSLGLIVRRLRGEAIDNSKILKAGWIVLGYCCRFILPDEKVTPLVITGTQAQAFSENNIEEIDLLNLLLTRTPAEGYDSINWKLIAKIVSKFLFLIMLQENPNA